MSLKRFQEESLVFRYLRGVRLIEEELGRELRTQDLSFYQALTLVALYSYGAQAMTPSQLAAALKLSRPTMSQILSRLEELGFIKRIVDPMDARSYQLKLNPARKRFVQSVINVTERCERLLGGLK